MSWLLSPPLILFASVVALCSPDEQDFSSRTLEKGLT
jgi:hypothetical protein